MRGPAWRQLVIDESIPTPSDVRKWRDPNLPENTQKFRLSG